MPSNEEQRNIAFKHALDVLHRRNDLQWFEETYPTRHIVENARIWADTPSYNDAAAAVAAGIAVQETDLVLTEDPFSAGTTWFAKLNPGVWPLSGGLTDYTTLELERIQNFISPVVFGPDSTLGYIYTLKENDGTPIPTGNWQLKFSEGILKLDEGFTAADMGWSTPLKLDIYRYVGSFGGAEPTTGQVLLEPVELTVSPTGNDPGVGTRIVVLTQADADTWGDFKTIAGAVSALPNGFDGHLATLRLPAGTWTIDPAHFGNLARFNPTEAGHIRLAGDDSWTTVVGSLPVASSSGDVVTFSVDPGLTPDAYNGYYLLVTGGVGTGQYKPIRNHTGTNLQIAGAFSPPLSGSTVEIVKRSTTLMMDQANIEVVGRYGHAFNTTLEIWGLNIVPSPSPGWWWFLTKDCTILMHGGCRLITGGVFGGSTNVLFGDVIIDSQGYYFPVIYLQGGTARTNFGSSSPMLLIGDNAPGYSAITMGTIGGNAATVMSLVFIFGSQCFDKWAQAYIELQYHGTSGKLNSSGGLSPQSDQGALSAVYLRNGANLNMENIPTFIAGTFKGTVNDINLDDTVSQSWSNLNTAKVYTSTRLSAIMENI